MAWILIEEEDKETKAGIQFFLIRISKVIYINLSTKCTLCIYVCVRNVTNFATSCVADNIGEHEVTFLINPALLVCDLVICCWMSRNTAHKDLSIGGCHMIAIVAELAICNLLLALKYVRRLIVQAWAVSTWVVL